MLTHRRGDFSLCLPISPHDTPYIFIHHTSSWQPHQPTTYDAEPIRTIGLAIRIPYFNSFRLLLCRSNHSAFNSHNFPRTYTTTYPCSVCRYSLATKPPHHVGPLDSEITPFLPVVLTDWIPSLSTPSALRSLSLPFQLRALHDPLRDYSPPILPLCIQYIQPTCRDCTLHVPRRLWKVVDSNHRVAVEQLRSYVNAALLCC